MKTLSLCLIISFFLHSYHAEAKKSRIVYYQNMFGHVHQNASDYSNSLTTIACGHPLKVLSTATGGRKKWYLVTTGGHRGYVDQSFVGNKRPSCFQKRYPEYFNFLKTEVKDLYYWGKLYDMYVQGKSKH